jgi:2-polyprenyl-3-methyl-5-hydroxy-6-metoxy-1,4-benzoquinol methylase
MSTRHYEAYGELARVEHLATTQAGRYAGQAIAERLILADIEPKLSLEPHHSLLEIGCGPGNLLIPLSFRVARAHGIDHPDVIARARARFNDPRVTFQGGFFPDVQLSGPFDRVLIYAVISSLPDWDTLLGMLDAAVRPLPGGGRLLLGDIPNADRKKRFLESPAGKQFNEQWKRGMEEARRSGIDDPLKVFEGKACIGTLDDQSVLQLMERFRKQGLRTYLLPQNPSLPFGHTREDMLIERP